MKTDELFHEYFQLVPQAFFDLMGITQPCPYRFSSPVIKTSQKRLDGLLEPTEPGHTYYFLEIQGYWDEMIYWRLVSEIGLYHEQNPQQSRRNWQAVILFLDKSLDPGLETLGPMNHGDMPWLVRATLSDLLHETTPASPVLHVLRPLVIPGQKQLRQQASHWIQGLRDYTQTDEATRERLLSLLTQFVIQKFSRLSPKEIERMFQLTPLEETVTYQEIAHDSYVKMLSAQVENKFGIAAHIVADKLTQLSNDDLLALSGFLLKARSYKQLLTWLDGRKTILHES